MPATAEKKPDKAYAVTSVRRTGTPESLAAYGSKLEELPVVVQLNKSDQAAPEDIATLRTQLGLPDAETFETVASEGQGVLESLTTISKQIVRLIRARHLEPEPVAPPAPAPLGGATTAPIEPIEPPRAIEVMEAAILAEGEHPAATGDDIAIGEAHAAFDRPWTEVAAAAKESDGMRLGQDMRIVSVGQAERTGERSISVPLILGNDEGESVTLSLGLSLEPLLEGGPGDPER